MALIRASFGVKEQTLAEPGEYELKIVSRTTGISKSTKKPMLTVVFGFVGGAHKSIKEFFMLETPNDDVEVRDAKARKLKRLCVAFEVPYEEDTGVFDDDDLLGKTAYVRVGKKERVNEETGETVEDNTVILPRFE